MEGRLIMKNNEKVDVKEFNSIKEIIYNSAEIYGENYAFVIKHKDKGEISYENVTYKRLLEDINKLRYMFL